MSERKSPPARLDPDNLAPVREFFASPIRHHSPELDAVLSVLRAGPIAGKYCLICVEPHRSWVIGRLSGERGVAPTIADNRIFTSIEDAERAIFKARWMAETGVSLDEEMLK